VYTSVSGLNIRLGFPATSNINNRLGQLLQLTPLEVTIADVNHEPLKDLSLMGV
jgi:hypothetical protein